ncbi:hypothetical protein LCGC14_2799460 [marine sediment metagenome]|uniref:Transketolase N-terminal domain-containing protein n=1 Tax=marine sediment metagenome TaxID=412755 RepID=A0A0F8YN80_9ZZZZ
MVDIKAKSKQLKNDVLDMCVKAGTGHVTSCFSCTEIMVALFYDVMKEGDHFLLSKGQASPLLYAILADKGIIPREDIDNFCHGKLGVHLDFNIEGVECTFGSLGNGVGIGIGMALADKEHTTYVLIGDGECYEGSVWEALIFAKIHNIKNLKVIVDWNGQMATMETSLVVKELLCSFPNVLIEDTTKGTPGMSDNLKWHGIAPQGEDARKAKEELNG